MKLTAAIILGVVTATPLLAQTTEINAALQTALDEQELMQTCSATLGPENEAFLVGYYQDIASETVARLDAIGHDGPELDAFRQIAATGIRRLPDQTPFGDILAFCNAQADWLQRLRTFTLFDLEGTLDSLGVPQ